MALAFSMAEPELHSIYHTISKFTKEKIYAPKRHKTVLLLGDSTGIVYHNDSALYAPVVLSVYDVRELNKCLRRIMKETKRDC